MWTTKTSKILLGGVNGQRNPGGGGPTRVTVTRRRRTKDTDANTTHTTNKKKRMRVPRAFAREYPTYDELPGNDAHGGRKPETQSNGRWQPTGNEEEDFFFKNTPREPQQHNMFYGATAYVEKFWCTNINNGPVSSCFCRKGGCFLHDGSFHNAIQVCLEEAPVDGCLLYTSPSPRDATLSRMPSSA